MAQQTHQSASQGRGRQSSQSFRGEGGQQGAGGSQGMRSQESRQDGRGGAQGESQGHYHSSSMSIPVIAMRGLGRIYDIQVAATRLMLQTQSSAASAFGWPDYSGLFRIADERTRRIFSAGTEQFLSLAEQANETTSEVQRQVGRMLESQAITEAENWQRGLEELGVQAEESLDEFKELALQQVEETIRAAESVSEESRAAIREGSDQFRQSIRQGMEEGRDLAARQGEEITEQTEEIGSEVREAGSEMREAAQSPGAERQTSKRKGS